MTKYKFLKKPSEAEEFSEASVHELRVLVALYESQGEIDEESFIQKTGTSRARLTSALALWEESGVIAERDDNEPPSETSPWGNRITEEFPERVVLGELEEESAADVARTIRNNKLAALFDECAAMMHKAMLTPAEIRRLSELCSQYELSEEYIATLAAHLAEENMLSVGILVKRAITLVGQGVGSAEALADYIAARETEKTEYSEYRRPENNRSVLQFPAIRKPDLHGNPDSTGFRLFRSNRCGPHCCRTSARYLPPMQQG